MGRGVGTVNHKLCEPCNSENMLHQGTEGEKWIWAPLCKTSKHVAIWNWWSPVLHGTVIFPFPCSWWLKAKQILSKVKCPLCQEEDSLKVPVDLGCQVNLSQSILAERKLTMATEFSLPRRCLGFKEGSGNMNLLPQRQSMHRYLLSTHFVLGTIVYLEFFFPIKLHGKIKWILLFYIALILVIMKNKQKYNGIKLGSICTMIINHIHDLNTLPPPPPPKWTDSEAISFANLEHVLGWRFLLGKRHLSCSESES